MQNVKEQEKDEDLENEETNDLYVNVEPGYSLWRQIVIVHTKAVWKNFIIISTVSLHLQLILYDISFRGRTSFPPDYDDLVDEKIVMDGFYVFDVLSALIYKQWTSLSSTYGHPPRRIVSLIVDVISLLPFDWVYRISTNGKDLRSSYLLSMNRLLRVHRVLSFFHSTRSSVGQRTVFIRILEYLVLLFLMTGVTVAGMIHLVDMVNLDVGWLIIVLERETIPQNEFEWCIVSYYVMMTQISGHGLPEAYPGMYSFIFTLIVLVSLWMLQAFEIAYLTDIILQQDYSRSLFHREMHLVENYLEEMDASKETKDKVKKYYNYFFKTQGNSEFKIMKFVMYPKIFLKECALELAWDAYKHSHLFRDQPIPFLRNLAIFFEREYYRPGELIIGKYKEKSKLIYVVSGVIHFLSEEDDKSPILSFSGGTLICESTLILSHKSLCDVVACTEVELAVLDRTKFVKLMVYRYQTIYRIIQSRIRFRYWKALRMVTIGAALQKHKSHIVSISACTDVAWLKQTLTALQDRQNRVIGRKEKKDVQSDAIFAATDFRYTFANLDMLVISDNIGIMKEHVCLNNGQIPCVFSPQSMILNYWEGFVLACCFALSLIMPTYASQPKYQSVGVTFFVNILCPVYLVDLIIVSSTAVHENDVVYTEIIDIIARRMNNLSYWADVVAAFPADWIFILFGSQNTQVLGYCKLNRLVKIYKFEGFFSNLERRMILSSYGTRVMKYTFYVMIIIYFFSTCILLTTCPNGKCDPSGWLQIFIDSSNEDMNGKAVTAAFLYASQIIIGIGTDMIFPRSILEYVVTIPILIIGAAVFNYVISSVTASQILDGFTRSWHGFNTMNIALMLDLDKVSKPIQTRVFRYLEMQWLANNAYELRFERQIFDTMTPKMRKELNAERLSSLIRKVDLFNEMEEDCITELCSVCKLSLLPPHEVVGYRGNACRAMYIIEKGHCQFWRNVDMTAIDVTTGTAVYVLEMLYNLRNSHSVTTVTHVSIVQITRNDLMAVLARFPTEKITLTKIMKRFRMSDEFSKLLTLLSNLPRQNMMNEIEEKWKEMEILPEIKANQKTQGYKKQKNIASEETTWKQTVLMLFLAKSTINPHGRFIKIWEGVRCTCSWVLIMIYCADAVLSQIIPEVLLTALIFSLNFMMVVDLYMRLHVQFYNSHKILVTHPLSTAKNYIKNGLVVDVLAIFPLEQFVFSQGSRKLVTVIMRPSYEYEEKEFIFLKANVPNMMVGALKYHYASPYIWRYIKCVMFMPLIILTAHVFACVLLHEFCEVRAGIEKKDDFMAGIYCSPKNVEIRFRVWDPISPGQMYLFSLLYVLATLTKIGAVNLKPANYTSILYVLFMTLISFLLLVVVTTYTISVMSRRDATLIAYQKQMMILMSYLKEEKVSAEFRDQVVNYFEYFWVLRRGTSLLKQMQLFPPELREDVLWCVYGPSLTKSPGFSKRNESFFRSLFSRVDVKFFSKGSEIMTVNLVHNHVYFIHWGRAEVLGPDGTSLAVLGCGSIFGNFTGSSTMRQTCSIMTRTHVEAMVIKSTDFFDLMMHHPNTKKRFLSAVALSTDYLSAEPDAEEVEVVGQTKRKASRFILLPNTSLVDTWDLFSVLFGCYLAFAMSLYHVAVVDFPGHWQILLYSVDLVFLIKIILAFFTAFEDELGDFVLDKTLIAKRFRKSRLGLYFHILMIIPFEVLCLFISNPRTKLDAFAWLRMNRVPRLILVVNYFRTACNRLNINISGKRVLYLIVLLVSLLHSAACLTIINEKATSEDTTVVEGIIIYVEKLYAVSLMFTVISPRLIPKNSPDALQLIVIFIVFFVAYAALLGEVCAVVDVNQFVMNEYERTITFFRDRVTRMDLTYVLRTNAWNYGSKLWNLRSGQQTPRLISDAPSYLQYAASYEMYGDHLLKNDIFGKLHEDFIRQLTFHFKVNLFFPGDTIVNVGDVDEMMYFIDKGIVHVSAPELNVADENRLPFYTLGPGQHFGFVQGLYERVPHIATYTAKTNTHIIYLHRLDWIYLLKYFPVSTLSLYREATRIIRATGLEDYV